MHCLGPLEQQDCGFDVLCMSRPCDGLIPSVRIPTKCLKMLIVPEVNSEFEQARGPNP